VAKLLETLDALAGRIAYEHCLTPQFVQNPALIVTAAVDKVLLLKRIERNQDVCLKGHVSWVGNSSMEISMAVQSKNVLFTSLLLSSLHLSC